MTAAWIRLGQDCWPPDPEADSELPDAVGTRRAEGSEEAATASSIICGP